MNSRNEILKLITLFENINNLKTVKRSGWPLHGVPDGESVADHSFQVAVMAMFLAEKAEVDQTKVIKMALLHDIGESIIGDEVTERGDKDLPNLPEKQSAERDAIRQILESGGMNEYLELFDEYMANKTPEAKFVRQLDKLEMAFQASRYEQSSGIDLSEFYISAKRHISNPILLEILDEIAE